MSENVKYEIAKKLAGDAALLARSAASKQMNISQETLSCIIPVAREDGSFGITVLPEAQYLWYQNYGFEPFIMYSLAGSIVPIRLPGGRVIFRFANPDKIGKPGKINKRDSKTGRILPTNNSVRWRHPGLEPKNFMEYGIEESVRRNYPNLSRLLLNSMIQEKIKKRVIDGKRIQRI